MLVLSRKTGERIHVGDEIIVEVKRVTGKRVTIAIEAPRDLRILRGELKEAATAFEIEMPLGERSPSARSASDTPDEGAPNKAPQDPTEAEVSNSASLPIVTGTAFLPAQQQLDPLDPHNRAFA